MVGDLWTMNRLIANEQPGVPIVFLGHSLGSFLGQDFVARHSDALAGAVFSGSSGKPPAIATLGRLIVARAERLRLGKRGKSPLIDSNVVRRLQQALLTPRAPPSTGFRATRRRSTPMSPIPIAAFRSRPSSPSTCSTRCPRCSTPHSLAPIRKDLPIYIFSGERDPVGANLQGLIGDLKDAGFTRLTTRIYPGARHETLNETNREEVTRDLVDWLDGAVGK